MSLDKAILHNKEHRKEYHGSKAIAASCRNGGTCSWCQMNRQYKNRKREESLKEKLREL